MFVALRRFELFQLVSTFHKLYSGPASRPRELLNKIKCRHVKVTLTNKLKKKQHLQSCKMATVFRTATTCLRNTSTEEICYLHLFRVLSMEFLLSVFLYKNKKKVRLCPNFLFVLIKI